jgi:hypothetical protein
MEHESDRRGSTDAAVTTVRGNRVAAAEAAFSA